MKLVLTLIILAGCTPKAAPTCTRATQSVLADNATTIEFDGTDIPSHVERCDDGAWNMLGPAECQTATTRFCPTDMCRDCQGDERCQVSTFTASCICAPLPCSADAACSAGACLCVSDVDGAPLANQAPLCIDAACQSEAECGGADCGIDFDPVCNLPMGSHCRTAEDECHGPAECDHGVCGYNADRGLWTCLPFVGACE